MRRIVDQIGTDDEVVPRVGRGERGRRGATPSRGLLLEEGVVPIQPARRDAPPPNREIQDARVRSKVSLEVLDEGVREVRGGDAEGGSLQARQDHAREPATAPELEHGAPRQALAAAVQEPQGEAQARSPHLVAQADGLVELRDPHRDPPSSGAEPSECKGLGAVALGGEDRETRASCDIILGFPARPADEGVHSSGVAPARRVHGWRGRPGVGAALHVGSARARRHRFRRCRSV